MKKDDTGFSFGAAGGHGANDDDSIDVDAVEVSGEPVSRSEAKTMGLHSGDTTRENKAATALLRRDLLPVDISDEISAKLELAWRHLRKNETAQALTLAQEVVWESPDLIPPKLIISRCFINRKEYDKSLAILSAIPEEQRNAEVQYYFGLTQSRLGRIREALIALKRARAQATDPTVRKQVADLLMQLQGEQTVCPKCGKKTLYDSMVEVGDQTVCANCAATMESLEDDNEELEESGDKNDDKRRKRLRPPLSRTDWLLRGVLAILLLVMLVFGLYLFYILSPDSYRSFRSLLPASWSFLPGGEMTVKTAPVVQNQSVTPKVVDTLTFDSPPLTRAVAGVELRHRAFIGGSEQRKDGKFTAAVTPQPTGAYAMNGITGEFSWTPSEKDAGKTFTITFSAVFSTMQARDQVSKVVVSSSPRFRNICTHPTRRPGDISLLVANDFTRDGDTELVVVTGQFWDGSITAYKATPDGFFTQFATVAFPGRPAGAGAIRADDEDWLAVADFWNSRLRYFAFRSGQIAEVAVDVDLPGRPVLAAFDKNSSTSVLLCRLPEGMGVEMYRQEGQFRSVKTGEWRVPEDIVWKRLLVLPGGDERPPLPVLCGGSGKRGIFLLDQAKPQPVPVVIEAEGTVLDAALGADGKVHCLLQNSEKLAVVSFTPTIEGGAANRAISDGGTAPALAGFAAVNFSFDGLTPDLAIFSTGNLGLSVGYTPKERGQPSYWPLPKPARLAGRPVLMPGAGGKGRRLAYMDAERDIWTVSLPGAED